MPTHVAGEGSMVHSKAGKSTGKLSHIEIHEGDNGGHRIVHVMHGTGPVMMAEKHPEHNFGPGEGDEALAHIARVMHIPGADEEEGEEEHKGNKEKIEVA